MNKVHKSVATIPVVIEGYHRADLTFIPWGNLAFLNWLTAKENLITQQKSTQTIENLQTPHRKDSSPSGQESNPLPVL